MNPATAPEAQDWFVQHLARTLVLQGKGPDQAARLARATWAELYPKPVPVAEPQYVQTTAQVAAEYLAQAQDCDDLYHAAKAGK